MTEPYQTAGPNWVRVEDEPWVDVLDLTSPLLQPIISAPRNETKFIGVDDLGVGWVILGDERGFFTAADGDERTDLVSWMPMK